jgi:hypothetical protein
MTEAELLRYVVETFEALASERHLRDIVGIMRVSGSEVAIHRRLDER